MLSSIIVIYIFCFVSPNWVSNLPIGIIWWTCFGLSAEKTNTFEQAGISTGKIRLKWFTMVRESVCLCVCPEVSLALAAYWDDPIQWIIAAVEPGCFSSTTAPLFLTSGSYFDTQTHKSHLLIFKHTQQQSLLMINWHIISTVFWWTPWDETLRKLSKISHQDGIAHMMQTKQTPNLNWITPRNCHLHFYRVGENGSRGRRWMPGIHIYSQCFPLI